MPDPEIRQGGWVSWPVAPATGAGEGFLPPASGTGTPGPCIHRLSTGDASMSEVSAGLSTSGRRGGCGSQPTCLVLNALQG